MRKETANGVRSAVPPLVKTSREAKYPPGPWYYLSGVVMAEGNTYQRGGTTCCRPENERTICERVGSFDRMPQEMRDAIGALLAAAPDLDLEARVLRRLATDPRLQDVTVREALAELAASGRGHDGGAALAKVDGQEWAQDEIGTGLFENVPDSRWKCPKCGSTDVQVSLPTWYRETSGGTLVMVNTDGEAEVQYWHCETCEEGGSGEPARAE